MRSSSSSSHCSNYEKDESNKGSRHDNDSCKENDESSHNDDWGDYNNCNKNITTEAEELVQQPISVSTKDLNQTFLSSFTNVTILKSVSHTRYRLLIELQLHAGWLWQPWQETQLSSELFPSIPQQLSDMWYFTYGKSHFLSRDMARLTYCSLNVHLTIHLIDCSRQTILGVLLHIGLSYCFSILVYIPIYL